MRGLAPDAARFQRPRDDRAMNKANDPVLLTLTGLLAASLTAFFLGLIPYPFGLLVLGILILARVLYLRKRER